MNDHEYTAWLWLMALPRMPWPKNMTGPQAREICDSQIKIKACPGAIGKNQGAPLVKVSALIPGIPKRVHGSGNDLYTACDRLQNDAWRAGVQLPFLSITHMQRFDPRP